MIDKIVLAPYYLSLAFRHWLYDSGIIRTHSPECPSISIGNITAGGTGKTPHTEMLLRILQEHPLWKDRNIAVLSRGYKRKSSGFQQVTADGTAEFFGDEPLQIKRKFPDTTVAVCKSRVKGIGYLASNKSFIGSKASRKCLDCNYPDCDLVILDDAFQYRKLSPTISIVLVDYNRPVYKDHLLPLGRLRDLPERLREADIIIVSKCPSYIEQWEKERIAANLHIEGYDPGTCRGKGRKKQQWLFFSTIGYEPLEPVFKEGDSRFVYSHRAILFSGIANDSLLKKYLSGSYKLFRCFRFPDHHKFTNGDISQIEHSARECPTAIVVTTEKDSQRLYDRKDKVPEFLRQRTFQAPIKAEFISDEDKERFIGAIGSFF